MARLSIRLLLCAAPCWLVFGCFRLGLNVGDGAGDGGGPADGDSHADGDAGGDGGADGDLDVDVDVDADLDVDGDVEGDADADSEPDGGGEGETCETAVRIDASGLGSAALEILVDTRTATEDYGLAACAGLPDVVFVLTDTPAGGYTFTCTGGGNLTTLRGLFAGTDCPPAVVTSSTNECNGAASNSGNLHAGTNYIIACRDGSLPPALLRIDGS